MAKENDGGPSISPLPFVAAALIAAGILVKTVPLESTRPAGEERSNAIRQLSAQDVEARLWQDPLVVRRVAMPPASDMRKRYDLATRDPDHALWRLSSLIHRELESGQDFVMLGANVLGGTHPEDAEFRRRVRFAVIAGLQTLGYQPDSAGAIGYVWLADIPRDRGDLGAYLPELLPYEWFTRVTVNGTTRLLLTWIEEDALGTKPVRALNRVAHALLCEQVSTDLDGKPASLSREACDERVRQTTFRIIGPADSGTLRNISTELRQVNPRNPGASRQGVQLELFSSGATIPDRHLPGIDMLDSAGGSTTQTPASNEYRLKLTRLTARDDALAGALADELVRLRGLADPKSGPGAASETRCATVVLLTEGDTSYGRALADEVRTEVDKECERIDAKPPKVVAYRYFRGLDGMLAQSTQGGGNADNPGSDKKRDRNDIEIRATPRERADGRSQYDYLRRLSAELAELDAAERRKGYAGVRAVGILGSDVYDKMLILQALHGTLPYAVFFTTDLDARLLHSDQNDWVRNLVVASPYGLSLRDALQGNAPPFRDSYQTGTYFSTLFALQPALQAAFGRDAGNGHSEHTTLGAQWFSRVQMYEIGRSRAVELTRGGGRQPVTETPEACSIETPAECALVAQDPGNPGTSRAVRLVDGYRGYFLLAAGSALLLVLLTSRAVRRRLLQSIAAMAVLAVTFGILTARAIEDDGSGRGEPLELLEGVSLWPTIYLRLFAIFAAIVFLVYGWNMIRRCTTRMHRRFFANERRAPDAPPRSRRGRGTDGMLASLMRPLHAPIERFVERLGIRRAFIEHRYGATRDAPQGRGNRRRLLAFVPAAAYSGDTADANAHINPTNGKLDARSAWRVHCCLGRFGPSAVRIGLTTALFTGTVVGLFVLDPPNLPYRGTEVKAWAAATTLASVFTFYLLLFAVVDLTRRATRFVRLLSERPTSWPARTMAREGAKCGLKGPLLETWIAFRVVVMLSSSVSTFIYCPFIVLLLLILARTTLFDSLNLPTPLIIVFGAAVAYLVYCSVSLRRAAESVRERAILLLNNYRLSLASGSIPAELNDAAQSGADPIGTLRAQIDEFKQSIAREREGAFASLINQPVVKALMIPFGGFGGMQVLEFFSIAPF